MTTILIIQEAGRHDANKHMRECFSIQYGLRYHNTESTIWGLGHDNFSTPFEELASEHDVILSLENYNTGWMPSLREINKTKIFWSIDSHCALGQHQQFCYESKIDILLNSTEYYNRFYSGLAKKIVWFPNAVDTRWFAPMDCEKKYDVGFCGSLIHDRRQWLDSIQQKLPIRVASGILGEEMLKEINSYRVSINKSIDVDIPYRIFETTACKLPIVTNYVPDLEKLYNLGEEIEAYRDLNELIDICHRLLENEELRNSLSQAGYERTLGEHSYKVRTKQLLDIIG